MSGEEIIGPDIWGQGVKRTKFSQWAQGLVQTIVDSEGWQGIVSALHNLLRTVGIPGPYPSPEQLLLMCSTAAIVLVLYYLFFGGRSKRRRDELESLVTRLEGELADAKLELSDAPCQKGDKPIRIWMDGAFDMMHYGHMNAFRQGRSLGTHLVVGVNSDDSIEKCKGTAPVLNNTERLSAVAGCKFVDEVVKEAPYIMNKEYIEEVVFGKYKCDYIVHGDDPCIVDGKDVFQVARDMGRYREIPRTEGVSTTDIVGRMLMVGDTRHHNRPDEQDGLHSAPGALRSVAGVKEEFRQKQPSRFLTTNTILRLFSAGTRAPKPGERIVYMDGAWDMFHSGHIETLKRAKEMGDFLIVGVHNDAVVNAARGRNYPIMNMNERVLSVLGCRYVDDVLLDAPWNITKEMIKSLNINVVAGGTVRDEEAAKSATSRPEEENNAVPKELDIFREFTSSSNLTVEEIVRRIQAARGIYEKKFEKKMKAETAYYTNRYGEKQEKK